MARHIEENRLGVHGIEKEQYRNTFTRGTKTLVLKYHTHTHTSHQIVFEELILPENTSVFISSYFIPAYSSNITATPAIELFSRNQFFLRSPPHSYLAALYLKFPLFLQSNI
jgi:hypothetical protein